MTYPRIIRALSRFDVATVEDISDAVGCAVKRTTWMHLQAAVANGHATREGSRGQVAKYQITDAGRAAVRERRAA